MNSLRALLLSGGLALAGAGSSAQAASDWQFGIDALRAEVGTTIDAPDRTGLYALTARPHLTWKPSAAWELKSGAKLFALGESNNGTRYDSTGAEPADVYVRYRHEDSRVTLGYQTVVWSRVDEVSSIDRVSRRDFSSAPSNPVSERRLAYPGLRWEQSKGDFKLDALAVWPQEGAVLPDARSTWYPIDQRSGQVLGLSNTPALAAFVRQARIDKRDPDSPGLALRLTHDDGQGLSWGLTLARTPTPAPHFEVGMATGRLTATHPRVRFAGVDAEFATEGATWRGEIGWTQDATYTGFDGMTVRRGTLDWVAGVEFFPGGGETRVSLQLVSRQIAGPQTILQVQDQVALNGEVSTNFARGTWTASVRFNVGVHQRDVFLAPRLAYTGMEPHEFYVGALLFSGEAGTAGGFYGAQDLLTFGVRTRF